MTEPRAEQLLDRCKIDTFIGENLTPTIALLRELVDYGVDLINKCAQHGGSLADLVITAHFFKHAVTMLDAVEIQLSRGAVFSAEVSARSMLEAYIYLAWILEKDTESRGRQFYVWHLRQKCVWARRVIPGTPEHKNFEKHIATLSDMKDPAKRAALEKKARKQDAEISAILSNSNNRPFNDAFDTLKKRHFDAPWYCPDGPYSIGDMAKRLKLDAEYDFFYSQFSDISHAGAFEKHVKFDGKAIVFEPIRSPEGIRTIVTVVATLAFRIFRLIIAKYFPQDMQSFNQSYITQWRTRFLSVPEVVVKDVSGGNLQQSD
ncbi:hypothetical protein KAX17_07615 [Candidatus Bipolaricaulota bacterium]|nr:hypothetical protein [Candidatus Bipolaricaulota bacterium]